MRRFVRVICSLVIASGAILAQTASVSEQVPRIIKFSGVAKDESGKPMSGVVGITFLLYKDEQGGAPLWMETQNVQADAAGHYTVLLGSATADGVSLALFSSAEVHWMSTQILGHPEQPRVALLSVPYALKAADAETLGGLPASAFVQMNPRGAPGAVDTKSNASTALSATGKSTTGNAVPPATVTGSGTTNFLPLWTSSTNLGSSILFQTGGNVGVGTKTPGAKLDTTGTAIAVRGISSGSTGIAVAGKVTNSSGVNFGVQGTTPSIAKGSAGVEGISSATTGFSAGVLGSSTSPNAPAVLAHATGLNATGVLGESLSTTLGTVITPQIVNSTTVPQIGVEGIASSTQGIGVAGVSSQWGVFGESTAASPNAKKWPPAGVFGYAPGITSVTYGVEGLSDSPTGSGVFGSTSSVTGMNSGVTGVSNSTANLSAGVNGYEGAGMGQVFGVNGVTASSGTYSAGVAGSATAPNAQVFGVNGATNSTGTGAAGVNGYEGATTGQVFGVSGNASSPTNGAAGVIGVENATTGNVTGVIGITNSNNGNGVFGGSNATSGFTVGVFGQSSSNAGVGVVGKTLAAGGTAGLFVNYAGSGLILQGQSGSSFQQMFYVDAGGNGFYAGNLNVSGRLTKGSGSFKIDHPLDPANKYISHSFVESPDMMNVYNGNVTTDRHGLATITLPDYFEALNRDFRYQLTVMGQFAQAIVARKISNDQFVIRTNRPHVEVSWQVTGIRQDAYANANRIPVEEDKPQEERGYYLHPEVFGQPDSKSIAAALRSALVASPGGN